jgi:IclR family transcriptional regulator, acetate operon repressor
MNVAGNSKDNGRSVAGKVLAILSAFAYQREFSNAEIARLTGLPASTAYRLLRELVVGGLLEHTAHRQYRPGPILHAIIKGPAVTRGEAR